MSYHQYSFFCCREWGMLCPQVRQLYVLRFYDKKITLGSLFMVFGLKLKKFLFGFHQNNNNKQNTLCHFFWCRGGGGQTKKNNSTCHEPSTAHLHREAHAWHVVGSMTSGTTSGSLCVGLQALLQKLAVFY